jgi:hypothetical protein
MKARHFVPFLCSALCATPALAQRRPDGLREIDPSALRVIPSKTAREIVRANAALGTGPQANRPVAPLAATLPVWNYTVTAAQDGRIYSGTIVGQPPTSGASTTIPAVLVPVVLRITQNGTTFVFDPTAADTGCLGPSTALALTQASPLFNSAPFALNGVDVGVTQWGDANARGQFWNQLAPDSGYHVLLSTTTGPTLTITINAGRAGNTTAEVFSVGGVQCGTNATTNPTAAVAVVNINTIDAQLQAYIASHGLNAGQFPFFVTYNAVISAGAANNLNNCCILGYHNALGNPGQTYGIGEFEGRNQTVFTGVADIAAPSHEVNEWLNDPAGTNPTPAWGNIGQVGGCQGNLEDGDPLSGTLMPTVALNGFLYHLQELAYFSWFYGGASLGTGGLFSSNGTFAGAAKLCPPGGTN